MEPDDSKEVADLHALFSDYLFVKPALVPAFKYNQTVGFLIHYLLGFRHELLELYFSDFSFKNRILNPVQITAAQLEHLAHAFFADIVH